MRNKYNTWLFCNDDGDSLLLDQAPLGWDKIKFNLIRDLVYLGVLKSISVEFEFVGAAYRFLQDKRLLYGMDMNILVRTYLNNPNTWLFDGKLNQENFREERKTRKYRVDVVQSSFVQDFNNREDVEINVLNNISLDRKPVTPAALENCLFRGKRILFFSEFRDSSLTEPEIYHHILPFRLQVNGNPGVNEVSNIQLDDDIEVLYTKENSFYINTLSQDQTIQLDFSINYTMIYAGFPLPNPTGPGLNWRSVPVTYFKLLLLDPDNAVVDTISVTRYENTFGNFTETFSESMVIPSGYSLIYTCERFERVTDLGPPPADLGENDLSLTPMEITLRTEITYNSMSMTITQDSIVADTTHPVLLPHELFANIIAQINGGSLYSEVFGRIDLGYYADGEFAYLGLTKGELLRGIEPDKVQIATSMREAFKSYSSVICLGAIITERQIRIDPLDILFNNNISTDLGEVEELVISPSKEFLFNSVKAGYPKNEYEQENGRDEFNTEYQYTNAFKSVKKELDLVSKYYGDGYGREFARRASVVTTGTADSRYDDMIFFVDMIKEDGNLKTRRLEGILDVSGIFSPETATNLRIAVGQNMLRWRKYLNIPLHKKDKAYYFQSKDKNASLVLHTELGSTIDGQDLDTGSQALFLPDQRGFKVPITITKLFEILANPLGLIKYRYKREDFFDFLMEVDSETDKSMSQWRTLGTRDSPVQIVDAEDGNILMHDDGLTDYVAHEDAEDDLVLYE